MRVVCRILGFGGLGGGEAFDGDADELLSRFRFVVVVVFVVVTVH